MSKNKDKELTREVKHILRCIEIVEIGKKTNFWIKRRMNKANFTSIGQERESYGS